MRIRIALLVVTLLAGMGLAAASGYADAAKLLDGDWRGDTYVLRVDAKRAQASMDPDRPFEWKRFLVKEVNGNEVVFSIGSELYEGRVVDNTLTLTGTSFRGERILYRGTGLRGSE